MKQESEVLPVHILSKIMLTFDSSKEAEVASKATAPDNLPLPKGLSICTVLDGKKVVVTVECRKGLQTFLSTVDDLLSSMQLALTTLRAVE